LLQLLKKNQNKKKSKINCKWKALKSSFSKNRLFF